MPAVVGMVKMCLSGGAFEYKAHYLFFKIRFILVIMEVGWTPCHRGQVEDMLF